MTTKDADPSKQWFPSGGAGKPWRPSRSWSTSVINLVALRAFSFLDEETFEANKGGLSPGRFISSICWARLFKALGAGKTLSDMGHTKRKHLEEDLRSAACPRTKWTRHQRGHGQGQRPRLSGGSGVLHPAARHGSSLTGWGRSPKRRMGIAENAGGVDYPERPDEADRQGPVQEERRRHRDINSIQDPHGRGQAPEHSGADLDTFLGNADLATFIHAWQGGASSSGGRKLTASPWIYKADPLEEAGPPSTALTPTERTTSSSTELVTSEENQRGVAESDLNTVVSEKKADAIRSDKGRIAGGMRVTPIGLKMRQTWLEKRPPSRPTVPALEIARKLRPMRPCRRPVSRTGIYPLEFRQTPTRPVTPSGASRREIYNDLVGTLPLASSRPQKNWAAVASWQK